MLWISLKKEKCYVLKYQIAISCKQTAFKSLQGNHLYQRPLALEWADNEETVETLRKKTAANFSDGKSVYHLKFFLPQYAQEYK